MPTLVERSTTTTTNQMTAPDDDATDPRTKVPSWLRAYPLDRCVNVNGDLLLPLGERLQTCLRLLRCADVIVQKAWFAPNLMLEQAHEHAQLALYRRSKLLVEAMVELASAGYSEQAFVQLRVLFEAMMDAFWVLQHPADVEDALLRHAELQRHELGSYLRSVEHAMSDSFATMPDDVARKRRREQSGSWTGQSLWARILEWEQVDRPELARAADAPGMLRETYNITIRAANLHVHGSLTGIFPADDHELIVGRVPYIDEGPSHYYSPNVVAFTFWCFDRVARITLAARDASTEQLSSFADRAEVAWAVVRANDARRATRNSACPCGAESATGEPRKFKHCHGRAAIKQEQLSSAFAGRRVSARSD